MKMKLVAVLLAVLIIGVTPAIAINIGEITADPMAVKGKGTAESAVQILENKSTSTEDNSTVATEHNTIENNDPADDQATDVQVPDSVENNDSVTSTNDQATGADTQIYDTSENTTISQATEDTQLNDTTETLPINTTGIVMQTTDYSCGPAALATVLQNMGINSTEEELKVLAGTDETGTSMHGLSEAAKAKGLSATGMKLSVDDLRPNNIVHVILDGEGHYSVVREVTNESVYLADPSKGNIELSREKFSEIYSGNALVITNPQEVNQTTEQVNNTDTSSAENLTTEEMEIIKGQQLSASANMQLTAEEMQTIRGKVVWKVIAKAAAAGAAVGIGWYLAFTPRHQWTWEGVKNAAINGALRAIAAFGLAKICGKIWHIIRAILRRHGF